MKASLSLPSLPLCSEGQLVDPFFFSHGAPFRICVLIVWRLGDNQTPSPSFLSSSISDLQQLENHMKSRKAREQEAREPVLVQLRGLVGTLQSATEQMAATVSSSVRAEVQHQLHIAVSK